MNLTPLVPIALIGWLPVVVGMFMLLPPRRALIIAYVGGWLFLPMWSYPLEGMPDYSKLPATSLGVVLGILFFDAARLRQFRLRLIDIPMLVWCAVPLASSLSNGLGVYDGASAAFLQSLTWGIPYFAGRLYLNDLQGMRELVLGLLWGGLAYLPLCLAEIRLSPQLHHWVYGYHQHAFGQTKRFGGFRPMVFMQHGLALSLFMAGATLIALYLWRTGSLKRVAGVPISVLVALLGVTTVLCKSVGALALLAVGLAVLWFTWRTRSGLAILLILLLPVTYVTTRTLSLWDGEILVTLAEKVDQDRSESIAYRLKAEELLRDKALEQPWFGWGAWGRNRVQDELGRDLVAVDGAWIRALGMYGVVGVASFFLLLLLPCFGMLRKWPPRTWGHPLVAPAGVMIVLIVLYALDNLLNSMKNPLFILAVGGMASLPSFVALYRGQLETAEPENGRRKARFPSRHSDSSIGA